MAFTGKFLTRPAMAAVCAGLFLSGCDTIGSQNRYTYEGVTFSGNAKAVKSDRASFVATAKPADQSLDGAIGAARYEGIKYCIGYLGTSDIVWTVGPETPKDQLVVDKGTLTLRGRCEE